MEREEPKEPRSDKAFASVEAVEFGVMSPGDILRLSVGEVIASQGRTAGPKPRVGTIHSERMGPMDRYKEICPTCERGFFECPGHFGHITLARKVVNSIFIKRVCDYLNVLCVYCCRLTIDPLSSENAKLILSIHGKPPTVALALLLQESSRLRKRKSKSYCQHESCGKSNQYKFKTGFNSTRGEFITCDEPLEGRWAKSLERPALRANEPTGGRSERGETNILSDELIHDLFCRLPLTDLELLGCRRIKDEFGQRPHERSEFAKLTSPTGEFDFHPSYLILTHLPVLPYRARLNSEYGGNLPNEQTTLYQEIAGLNAELTNLELGREPLKKRRTSRSGNVVDPYYKMRTKIHALMDNSKSLEAPYDTKVPLGIKDLIKGKDGLIRKNLMGKRVNQAARTVIGPDISLSIDEVAVPRVVCEALHVKDYVTLENRAFIQGLIDRGEATLHKKSPYVIPVQRQEPGLYVGKPGDQVIGEVNGVPSFVDVSGCILGTGTEFYRNGVLYYAQPEGPENEEEIEGPNVLDIGDSVHRNIQDGDFVLFNRQPSLHKYSMTGMRVKRTENLTFGLNVAACKIFNADFDGDECVVHFPTTIPARVEIEELTSPKSNLISVHNGKFLYPLVQDAMLGAYLMTKENPEIDETEVDRLLGLTRFTQEYITRKKLLLPRPFTGRSLFSFCLPFCFWFTEPNGEEEFRVENGVLRSGSYRSAIQDRMMRCITLNHSPEEAMGFTNNIQFIAYGWLTQRGFSIGIKDCLLPTEDSQREVDLEINQATEKAYDVCRWYLENRAVDVIGEPLLEDVREFQVITVLRDVSNPVAKVVEQRLATEKSETTGNSNGFYTTITAGSKGSLNNVVQITGMIGQQTLPKGRIGSELGNGERPLVWFNRRVDETYDQRYFEAHGMIRSSFSRGLSPRELVLAAMAYRPDACDKTVNIRDTGYTQRRLVKLLEDVVVRADETVRDGGGRIIQPFYADSGLSLDLGRILDLDGLVESLNAE